MKKLLVCAAALILCMAVFAACGSDDEGPVTLIVSESDGGPDVFLAEAGRRFTELHPHVTVEFMHVEIGGAADQFVLDGPLGLGPDVLTAPHDQIGRLLAGGHILPVPADRVSAVQGMVGPAAITGATDSGILWGYPVAVDTYALFFNRDLIDEADVPTTFEDLVAFSRRFNADNPGMHGFMFEVGAYWTFIFITMDGNRLFGPSGEDRVNTNINSPAAIRGMEFMRSLREILDFPSGDLTGPFIEAQFEAGNLALLMTGPWNIGRFVDAGMNFGVTTLPRLPGQATPASSFSGVRTMFVSAYSDNTEYAHLFAEFLLSPEMQLLRYEITAQMPPSDIPIANPYHAGIVRQMAYAFPMPAIPEMGAYWAAMNAASENIWDGMDVTEQLNMAHEAMVD